MSRQIPFITAHEGCEGTPGNTLLSVQAGIEADADVIEVDVRSTKDNIAVLAHDSKIRTVSGSSIPIGKLDYNDLVTMEKNNEILFDNPENKITRLSEVFNLIRSNNKILNLDAKDDASIEPLVKTVQAANMVNHVFVSGCEWIRASYLTKNHPEFQVLYNVESSLVNLWNSNMELCIQTICRHTIQAGCCGINIPYQYCTTELVEYAHVRFMPVSVWTVDKKSEMQKYIDMGVYSITTNKPRDLKNLIYDI